MSPTAKTEADGSGENEIRVLKEPVLAAKKQNKVPTKNEKELQEIDLKMVDIYQRQCGEFSENLK